MFFDLPCVSGWGDGLRRGEVEVVMKWTNLEQARQGSCCLRHGKHIMKSVPFCSLLKKRGHA
jgi:hypothetical protein